MKQGFVILDKPPSWSSQQAVTKVKYLFGAKKAGHAGTLDPMATGILIIAFGRATKLLSHLVLQDKKYSATIQLGIATDTLDKQGQVIAEKPVGDLSLQQIEDALACFRGGYAQIPPMYSALKKDGKCLYKLARSGVSVAREARNIKIYKLDCLEYNSSLHQLKITVHCSKGTYIRSLAQDIATKLDTLGHLIALRRTASGCFSDISQDISQNTLEGTSENTSEKISEHTSGNILTADLNKNLSGISWDTLQHASINSNLEKYLVSVDTVFSFLDKVVVTDDYAIKIQLGIKNLEKLNLDNSSLDKSNLGELNSGELNSGELNHDTSCVNLWFRLHNSKGLFAIAQIENGVILTRKLLD